MPGDTPQLTILLVADESASTASVAAAFRDSKVASRVVWIPIGKNTVTELEQFNRRQADSEASLVLYDATDPRPATIEMLKRIRTRTARRRFPLAVLTSDTSRRALEAPNAGGEENVTFSPIDLPSFVAALEGTDSGRFVEAIRLLEDYGLVSVRIPHPLERPHGSAGRLAAPSPDRPVQRDGT